MTHRKEDVAKVHEEVNDGTDASKVRSVTRYYEAYAEDVVCEHLPVIFSTLLRVDHVDLVKPPSELSEVIEFCEAGEEGDGVSAPQLLWGERRGDAPEYDLGVSSARNT